MRLTNATGTADAHDTQDVLCEVDRACGVITLNRPAALNALTTKMRAKISTALTMWQRDPMVYAVVIESNSDRAFCAGGDLREFADQIRDDPAAARASAAAEYALNWQIECFTKPIAVLIDGVCMGSGVGLTAYATHRIGAAGYGVAMPEVSVGYFPDVGATWLLSQLPGNWGQYLGLSGRTIARGDALALGLVSHAINADKFSQIKEALALAMPIDPLIDDLAMAMTPETPPLLEDVIKSCFSAPDVPAIVTALESVSGEAAPWACELATEIRTKSPTSLAVTHRQLTTNIPQDVRIALLTEYRQACAFINTHDLHEGIRALLVDKDKNPQWRPSWADMPAGVDLDRFFDVPEGGDMHLAPRPASIPVIA